MIMIGKILGFVWKLLIQRIVKIKKMSFLIFADDEEKKKAVAIGVVFLTQLNHVCIPSVIAEAVT